jgi:hypothetical protein
MSDVTCPCCKHEQEINHDDGYGYEDGETHEQECTNCTCIFNFTTSISFNYNVYCGDGEHMIIPSKLSSEVEKCENCDLFRLVEDENKGGDV